jgi:hypothetical protein
MPRFYHFELSSLWIEDTKIMFSQAIRSTRWFLTRSVVELGVR